MYLLYVDESGEPSNLNEQYFVLGAVAVYENNAYFLSRAIDEVQEKWFPSAVDPIEFHAAKIRNRSEEPWCSLRQEQCYEILSDLCSALEAFTEKQLVLFGVAIHKPSFQNEDPVEKAFHEICGHFDEFIEQSNLNLGKMDKNRGLMILDSAKYKGHLDTLLLEYRKTGKTKFGRVKNFADAPTFANSKTTRLIQVADLVSYAIFRRYEKSNTLLLDKIVHRFHRRDRVIHGLMHHVSRYRECTCPACLSRQ
jgi:hypothetical protein